MVLRLQQAAEDARKALDSEKKQVEGESLLSSFCLLVWFTWDPLPILVFSFAVFRHAERSGELDDPGRVPPDGLQLLAIGVGGAAGHRPRGVPRGRGG
jgi:hypothetical protein